MKVHIIGEDFTVTEAMNAQIEERAQKIITHMRTPSDLSVFLKKISAHEFEVKFQTHHRGVDFVGQGQDRDFYLALNQAKKSLLRQLDDHHSKKLQARRQA